jgi:hypothetical protein
MLISSELVDKTEATCQILIKITVLFTVGIDFVEGSLDPRYRDSQLDRNAEAQRTNGTRQNHKTIED